MSKANNVDFSKDLSELEEIVAWFESGDVDLDKALEKFERGMELAANLKNHLETVENKVTKIKQKFEAPAEDSPEEDEENEDTLEQSTPKDPGLF